MNNSLLKRLNENIREIKIIIFLYHCSTLNNLKKSFRPIIFFNEGNL